jgi:CheY-like chemotaxis protein
MESISGKQEGAAVTGRGPTILLAEDNPADVYLIREALREHGVECAIREASDGKEVLGILSAAAARDGHRPLDLIILDLNLPRHDGIEILQHLQSKPELTHVPVVVLTSSDSPRDRQVATQLGAECYLRKPSSLTEFLNLGAVFRDLLERSNGKARGQMTAPTPRNEHEEHNRSLG